MTSDDRTNKYEESSSGTDLDNRNARANIGTTSFTFDIVRSTRGGTHDCHSYIWHNALDSGICKRDFDAMRYGGQLGDVTPTVRRQDRAGGHHQEALEVVLGGLQTRGLHIQRLRGGQCFGGIPGPLGEATFSSSNISGHFFRGLCGGTLLVQHQKHLVTWVWCTSPCARRFWRFLGCHKKARVSHAF